MNCCASGRYSSGNSSTASAENVFMLSDGYLTALSLSVWVEHAIAEDTCDMVVEGRASSGAKPAKSLR